LRGTELEEADEQDGPGADPDEQREQVDVENDVVGVQEASFERLRVHRHAREGARKFQRLSRRD